LVTFEEPRVLEGHWETDLKVDYPMIIQDDKTTERMIRFLSFRNLGHLRFTRDFRVTERTSNEECAEVLRAYLAKWRERTERIVVEASARNLARVGRMREALNPIYVIVHNLLTDNEISRTEIAAFRRPQRSRQYLSLLEQNEIVRKTDTGYTYGNAFASIQTGVKEKNPKNYIEAMKESVIAHIVKQNYSVLREVFRVSRLEPYVHMDNCYYEPALQAGKLLYQKENTLIERYNRVYPRVSPLELKPILHELAEVDTLTKEGDYFYGTGELFAEMQQMQSELPEFASLVA
jgi:hypothetical protein